MVEETDLELQTLKDSNSQDSSRCFEREDEKNKIELTKNP